MRYYDSLARLIAQFQKLPGIGSKTAQRLAFYILKMPEPEVREFAAALVEARAKLLTCSVCGNMTDSDPCHICSDPRRERKYICVVQEPRDVLALERTNEYRGQYHVLNGAISPLDGIGPDELNIKSLLARIRQEKPEEIIVATNPNVQGEATAMYLAQILKPFDIRVTRLALGLPVGGDLEYADEMTLARALEGRKKI
ncbi:MAG: recombination protein RecR [Firmicutes bacterium]|jgi:recombination protein RecR|nr:recombination protein RecR [Bacillota bacterium]HOB34805.1 recombination mediator RecR [Bacillota bacterium]HPZ91053.1 recombination mediator RecR [Bacillota bacterium]HQE02082.1 recombination mediator RecR [Bacillota bacterium]